VFVLYIVVLRYWSASRAAYTFVLVPVVTVVLSWWLDDEAVGAGLVLGGLLVLAGVYVGALRPAQMPPARPAAPSPAEDGLEGQVFEAFTAASTTPPMPIGRLPAGHAVIADPAHRVRPVFWATIG
jgi:hypothetical protein